MAILVSRIFVSCIFIGRKNRQSQNSSVAILPYYYILYTSLRLIISKIVRAKSPLSSLSPLYYGDIVALLYKKLGIGSRLVIVRVLLTLTRLHARELFGAAKASLRLALGTSL